MYAPINVSCFCANFTKVHRAALLRLFVGWFWDHLEKLAAECGSFSQNIAEPPQSCKNIIHRQHTLFTLWVGYLCHNSVQLSDIISTYTV